MRFAFIADIHLSRYSQDKIEKSTRLPERLHSIKNTLYNVAEYCIENDIETIVIGGDIMHGKSVIYAIAQDIMIQYFRDYSDKLTFYVIDGNHDLSGKAKEVVSALRPLENIENVTWVPFSKTLKLQEENILFVPYSTDLPEIIKDNRAKILISHFGLSEGILNSGLSIVSDISLKHLRGKYDLVLLGHYHKPQEIIEENLSVYYVGSLIQLDWGEKDDEKRFLVVDSDTLDVESVHLEGYRKHIEINITDENIERAIKLAEQAKADGDHIKIIMREKVDLTGLPDNLTVIDKTEKDITDRGITSSMSEEDKINRYLEIQDIPEEEREEYQNVAYSLVKNCEV